MARPDRNSASDAAPHYSTDAVRGGEIVLRTRAERLIFIGGIVGAILLGLVLLWVR